MEAVAGPGRIRSWPAAGSGPVPVARGHASGSRAMMPLSWPGPLPVPGRLPVGPHWPPKAASLWTRLRLPVRQSDSGAGTAVTVQCSLAASASHWHRPALTRPPSPARAGGLGNGRATWALALCLPVACQAAVAGRKTTMMRASALVLRRSNDLQIGPQRVRLSAASCS